MAVSEGFSPDFISWNTVSSSHVSPWQLSQVTDVTFDWQLSLSSISVYSNARGDESVINTQGWNLGREKDVTPVCKKKKNLSAATSAASIKARIKRLLLCSTRHHLNLAYYRGHYLHSTSPSTGISAARNEERGYYNPRTNTGAPLH